MNDKIVLLPDADSLAAAAADRLVSLGSSAIVERGRFSVALAGGSTPRRMYALLATERYASSLDWLHVHFFWGDERCVPPDHPGSNYHMAREVLLDHLPVSEANVHRVRGELEPTAAAQLYAEDLQAFFGAPWPAFDLVLLGLGNDGHTASLFPGSSVLEERKRAAVAVTANYQDRPAHRVTLTFPAINAARQVLFLVSGASKAGIVAAVLEGSPGRYPAQGVRPGSGRLGWMLDAPAATHLPSRAVERSDKCES